jgi:hypothetical protein
VCCRTSRSAEEAGSEADDEVRAPHVSRPGVGLRTRMKQHRLLASLGTGRCTSDREPRRAEGGVAGSRRMRRVLRAVTLR